MQFSDRAHLASTNDCDFLIIEDIFLAAPMCVPSSRKETLGTYQRKYRDSCTSLSKSLGKGS